MSNVILYKERLPKYVFKGSALQRKSIQLVQCIFRFGTLMFFIGSIYLLLVLPPNENRYVDFIGVIAIWVGCTILVYKSELVHQKELDGSVPIIINESCMSIPPRIGWKLARRSGFIDGDQIDHVRVIRGNGGQYLAKKEGVCWMDSPIGIKIVTKSGKVYSSGYKPPSTVKEILDVLATHWKVRIEDPGFGMGRGMRYVGDKVLWEHTYEEIMQMNLFEWQE